MIGSLTRLAAAAVTANELMRRCRRVDAQFSGRGKPE